MRHFSQVRFRQQTSSAAAVPSGWRPPIQQRAHRGNRRASTLTALQVCWVDRIYSPLVTMWVFLGQVLGADYSCRAAVARLVAHRVARGQPPVFRGDRSVLPGAAGCSWPTSRTKLSTWSI